MIVRVNNEGKRLDVFERYLTLWVALCILVGVLFGRLAPGVVKTISQWEFSGVNLIIAILIWLMIYPMMLRIDFAALKNVGKKPRGILITLFVNWVVKPFSMAFLAWLFFNHVFAGFLEPALAQEYIAGCIILAAAPCTAMVFVWSYLVDGDPAYTLVQVALNDLIMLVLFAPIVMLLLGVTDIVVPKEVLFFSVLLYIVIPLFFGYVSRQALLKAKGEQWFENTFLVALKPVTIIALLVTLIIIFAFQGEVITANYFNILLIAIPITIQVYFNSSLAYGLSHIFKVPFAVAAPGALIGASNFFELAVAVAISLFGLQSGAALATVVGVLVEVPVMLSVVALANRTRGWFEHGSEVN